MSQKELRIADIPVNVLAKMRDEIWRMEEFKKLNAKRNHLLYTYHFLDAANVGAEMIELEKKEINKYWIEYQRKMKHPIKLVIEKRIAARIIDAVFDDNLPFNISITNERFGAHGYRFVDLVASELESPEDFCKLVRKKAFEEMKYRFSSAISFSNIAFENLKDGLSSSMDLSDMEGVLP